MAIPLVLTDTVDPWVTAAAAVIATAQERYLLAEGIYCQLLPSHTTPPADGAGANADREQAPSDRDKVTYRTEPDGSVVEDTRTKQGASALLRSKVFVNPLAAYRVDVATHPGQTLESGRIAHGSHEYRVTFTHVVGVTTYKRVQRVVDGVEMSFTDWQEISSA